MKKIILLFALVLIPSIAHAEDWTPYAFEDAEGVKIIYLKPGSELNTELKKAGFTEVQPVLIDKTALADRKDREFWTLQNGVIGIDQSKKQIAEEKKLAEEQAKQAVLDKLKITDEELKAVTIDLAK